MPAKKQGHSSESATAKPQAAQPAAQSEEMAEQQSEPGTAVRRAGLDPRSLSPQDVLQLQRMMGNQEVGRLLAGAGQHQPIQKKGNNTGLPDNVKSGIEDLSGMALDDVKVHYNSSKPAELQALAYTQGTDIHVGQGQEKHLPHEAWHVVQQQQGKVWPTTQIKGQEINDDVRLEREADLMGKKALLTKEVIREPTIPKNNISTVRAVPQRVKKTIGDLDQIATYNNDPQSLVQHASLIHIGANQTGDMYHVRAALALYPDLYVYIWGVPIDAQEGDQLAQAKIHSAVQIAEYVIGASKGVIYSEQRKLRAEEEDRYNLAREYSQTLETNGEAPGFMLDVGQATSLVAIGLDDATIRQGMSSATDNDKQNFEADLRNHGFTDNTPYILVNYRGVGNKPGGVHPEHDTGITGFRQLMDAARKTGATPVPMGDPPIFTIDRQGASLEDYWTWDSTRGRGRDIEAGLLRCLNQSFNIVGAVGMRSGIMDLLAFVGIPILSIDIDPVFTNKPDKNATWSRTNKLESAYGSSRYGTIYTGDRDLDKRSPYASSEIEGEFNLQSMGYIKQELAARHKNERGAVKSHDRGWHETHPYGAEKAQKAKRLVKWIIFAARNLNLESIEIERHQRILNQLSLVVNQVYAQWEYAGYDKLWDEVHNLIIEAENALNKLEGPRRDNITESDSKRRRKEEI